MKHSWLPAVIVFAGVLALGNFVLGPIYCRGEFEIQLLDRAAICAAQTGFTRSASMLFYFGAVALALFVGVVADKLPRRAAAISEATKPASAKPVEPVEQAAVVPPTPSVAAITAAPKTDAPKTETATAEAAATPAPAPEAPKIDLAAAVEQALKANQPPPAAVPVVAKPAPAPSVTPTPAPAAATLAMPPPPVLPPPPKPTPIPKPWQQAKAFEGTNEELIARFKELGKQGGVEAIATAQRNLDESTLSALASGIDPKQHLSQIAHLLLMDEPELKSDVARGVVVHIAARLKELGVVANIKPGNTSA